LDAATARHVRQILRESPLVKSVEDLDFHDYGPENSILLARVSLAVSPHTAEFEEELDIIKRNMKKIFAIDETIIYWPPTVRH
jgi:Co/Zn/Cd efflux system component